MRVLYLSRVQEIDKPESIVAIALDWFAEMLAADHDLEIVWTIPRASKESALDTWYRSRLGDGVDRVKFWPITSGLGPRKIGMIVDETVAYAMMQQKVKRPYDVVLSNQPGTTPQLKALLANTARVSQFNVTVPFVQWQLWTATAEALATAPQFFWSEEDVIAESLSAVYADLNIWESQLMLDEHVRTWREMLKPAKLDSVIRKSTVLPNGVKVDELMDVQERRRHMADLVNEPVLFWAGRLSPSKRWETSMSVLAKVQSITGSHVLIATPDATDDANVESIRTEHPSWEVRAGLSPEQFRQTLVDGDVFACNSEMETYGVAWLEMMAAGLVGVFEDRPWVRGMFGQYPLVANSIDVQVEMIVAVLKLWPDVGRLGMDAVQQMIEKEHDSKTNARMMGKMLRARYDASLEADSPIGRSRIGQLAVEAVEALGNSTPMESAIWSEMNRRSEGRKFGGTNDMVSRMYLRRALRLNGWHEMVGLDGEMQFVGRSS